MKNLNQSHQGEGDNIGRDKIIIQLNSITKESEQLISILKLRAKEINEKLSGFYKYVEIKGYLDSFNELHQQHVNAIENGNLIFAHEILIKIHYLSSDLESSEFWTRHRFSTPFANYCLRPDAFQRGIIVCAYTVGEMKTFSSKYPSFFSKFENWHFRKSMEEGKVDSLDIKEDIVRIYRLILNSKK